MVRTAKRKYKKPYALQCQHQLKFGILEIWHSTWRTFLHYDRGGVGRQVDHSSWCFFLLRLCSPGQHPLSWPESLWCSLRISSLLWNCRHASPNAGKHLPEIWVQIFPEKESREPEICITVKKFTINTGVNTRLSWTVCAVTV